MDRQAWLKNLRERASPFVNQAAPTTAWSDRPPDVRDINKQAIDGILGLIKHFAAQPDVPVACLLDGEVGAGKTHVIGSICHRLTPDQGSYSFAEVKPLTNPKRPLKHLLASVVTNLNQRPPARRDLTQLDRITARVIAKFLHRSYSGAKDEVRAQALNLADQVEKAPEKLQAAGRDEQKWDSICNRVREWLVENHPDVWSKCVKVFLQYPVPRKRAAVIEWLKGETLDQPELELIGLKYEEGDGEIEAVEDRAGRTLITLGHLLKYDRPLVVCFDQLESLEEGEDDSRLRAFGKLVFHLFNYVPSMMMVTSVRGEKWNTMRDKLDTAALQRIESSHFKLKPCDRKWARELIASRLTTLGLPEDAPPLFPFDQPPLAGRLDEALASGTLSARLVLQKANKLWLEFFNLDHHVIEEDPLEVLDRWVKTECAKFSAAPDQYPPDEGTLTEALRLQLHAIPPRPALHGCAFLTPKVDKRYVDLVIQLQAKERMPRVAFLVDNEQNAIAVGTSFKHGRKLREAKLADKLFFLRDGRVAFPPKPKWPATNDLHEEFGKAGGASTVLTTAEVSHWYAVLHAYQAILAGDITMLGPAGQSITLGKAHFDQYLARRGALPQFDRIVEFCCGPFDGGTADTGRKEQGPLTSAQVTQLREHTVQILRNNPVKMMKTSTVLGELPADLKSLCRHAQVLIGVLKDWERVAQYGDKSGKPEEIVLGLKGPA